MVCAGVLTGGCGQQMTQAPPPPPAITVSVSPQAAAIGIGQGTSFKVTTNDSQGVKWTASSGNIDANGNYTAPSGAQSTTATVTATSVTDSTKSASATVNVVASGGPPAPTANLQVALFTIAPAAPGNVSVQFGITTTPQTYPFTTWTQPVPQGGGPVSIFVAGMKPNTPYHMRGVVQFADGSQFMDADQTFTTGLQLGPAGQQVAPITTTTTAGMTPQSGVEMLSLVGITLALGQTVAIADLNGNVLWSYEPPSGELISDPVKLLPNGHFLMNFNSGFPDGANSQLQEVDLTGTVVWQITGTDLNNALQASCTSSGVGCNLTVVGTHHDFVLLPSGHLVVLAGTERLDSTGTTVVGDVLIDLKQNFNTPSSPATVFWVWNEFDHLDLNRRPYMYPDWTHSNAVVYSTDDGNLLVSIRHQNWVVKVNYANGTGDGSVIWHLGYQGDFALLNADGTPDTNAADWFFAQHGPSFVSTNTTGKFTLTLFDNGDDRGVTVVAGGTCSVGTEPPCFSTVPIFDIDETAMTAKFALHPMAPVYSVFGGNAEVLKNGNLEYCESAGSPGPVSGHIYEVTNSISSTTVWDMVVNGEYAYRGQRLPSLYPGVQW